jgi:hypothetical protein
MDHSNVVWGFVGSDWAGCRDSRQLTSGSMVMLKRAAGNHKHNLLVPYQLLKPNSLQLPLPGGDMHSQASQKTWFPAG